MVQELESLQNEIASLKRQIILAHSFANRSNADIYAIRGYLQSMVDELEAK
jgi:hypothetical protein